MTSEHDPKPRNPNWGGRRRGAGAPKGNINALKHGRRSQQFAEIGAMIARSDEARNALLALANRRQRHDEKAEAVATEVLVGLINHAKGIAAGRDTPGPFRHLLRSNDGDQALTVVQSRKRDRALEQAALQARSELHQNPADNQPSPPQSTPPPPPDTNHAPKTHD